MKRLPIELGLCFHRFIASGEIVLKCDVYNYDGGDIAPVTITPLTRSHNEKSGRTGYPVTFR